MLNILIFGPKLIKFFKFFMYLWYFLCKFFNQKVMALQKYTLLGRMFHSCHYNYYCHYCPYVAMSVCHIRRSFSVGPPPQSSPLLTIFFTVFHWVYPFVSSKCHWVLIFSLFSPFLIVFPSSNFFPSLFSQFFRVVLLLFFTIAHIFFCFHGLLL